MLSRDDAQLVARDRELLGLSRLLDPNEFGSELELMGLCDLEAVTPRYLRYKPETSCLVSYSVHHAGRDLRVHATTYGKVARDKADKARTRAPHAVDAEVLLRDGGFAYSEKASALVSFYPFDTDLPVMRRIHDPALCHPLLERTFRDFRVPPEGSFETLAYKPGRRFVARLRSTTGSDYVLRFYASARQERAARQTPSLGDRECLRVPKRVGGSKRHRIAALEWISGVTLRDLVRAEAAPEGDLVARVARALAEFHDSGAAAGTRLLASVPGAGLREIQQGIAWLAPASASLAESICDRLVASLRAIPLELRLIHGDLYDKQIIVADSGVALVDLDEVRLGDAREDMGLFVAHWERDRLAGDLGPVQFEVRDALLEHYRRISGRSLPNLHVFTAAALFRLAQHPFRNRVPDWKALVHGMLVRTSEILEGR